MHPGIFQFSEYLLARRDVEVTSTLNGQGSTGGFKVNDRAVAEALNQQDNAIQLPVAPTSFHQMNVLGPDAKFNRHTGLQQRALQLWNW